MTLTLSEWIEWRKHTIPTNSKGRFELSEQELDVLLTECANWNAPDTNESLEERQNGLPHG